MRGRRHHGVQLAAAVMAWCVAAPFLQAQRPAPGTMPMAVLLPDDFTAGSPTERTLLIALLLGRDAPVLLTRPLPPGVGGSLLDAIRGVDDSERPSWTMSLSPPFGEIWYNSLRPRDANDGAVWQGRGVTAAVSGGATLEGALFSLSLRPVAFVAQNAAFSPFRPPPNPDDFRSVVTEEIDRPFRFGSTMYGQVDPGESWLRIGTRHVAIGASTASQHWGPAHHFPLVLGTESGGFPRVFSELRSLNVGLGRVDAQWIVGRLEASPHSRLVPGERSRMATAFMAAFAPRGAPGLQFGGSRFFHARWRADALTWTSVTLPFAGLLKEKNPTGETTALDYNQLGSVFVRIAPPGAGVEVYGELYREDHNFDGRDLVAEPDHQSGHVLGIRRAWRTTGEGVMAVTVENANGRISHLARVRSQRPLHVHGRIGEGHTYRGQPLGSSNLLGGGGTLVALDRIGAGETWGVEAEVRHTAQDREGGSWDGRQAGLYSIRLKRWRQRAVGIESAMVGLERGFGLERGVNVTLSFGWRFRGFR